MATRGSSRFDLLLRFAMPVIGTLVMMAYRHVEARLEKLEEGSPVVALTELKSQAKAIEQRLERLERGQEQVLQVLLRIEAAR